MIVWAGWTLPLLLTAPGMLRGPSALRFRSHSLAGSRQIFYCISAHQIHFIGVFLEIRGIWSKDFCGWNCTSLGIWSECRGVHCWIPDPSGLNPFFAGLCPVCCPNAKMCRGTNEKMLILSEMIVVGWRTIGGHDDWPEFQAAEWWHKACAVMTENDPCVWYSLCPRYAFMYENSVHSIPKVLLDIISKCEWLIVYIKA